MIPSNESFQGGAFSETLQGGRCMGTIGIHAGRVRFQWQGGNLDWSIHQLKISEGGASNRLIFLTHPLHPGWTIFSPDKGILKNQALESDAGVREQVRRIRSKQHFQGWVTASVLLAMIAAFCSLFLLKKPIVGFIADRIPPKVERKIGETVLAQITVSSRKIENVAVRQDLEKLIAPLVAVIPQGDHPLVFHIIEDSEVNAFALPGGFVVLNSGLLVKADRAEEVLGVVAHEIAHVTARHSMRNLVESIGVVFLAQFLFGDLSGLAAILVEQSSFLLRMQFSRENEREADQIGLGYLIEAGIPPDGLITFFEKLHEKQSSGAFQLELPTIMQTHPATMERIQSLREQIALMDGAPTTAFEFDYAAFRERIQNELFTTQDEPQP
jgi:predicted Zn-dependent protease